MLQRTRPLGLLLAIAGLAALALSSPAMAQARSDDAAGTKAFRRGGTFDQTGAIKYYTRLIDPPTVYSPRRAGEMEALDPSRKSPPTLEETASGMNRLRPSGPEQAGDEAMKGFADVVLFVDDHTRKANVEAGQLVELRLAVKAWRHKHFVLPPRWILEIELNGAKQVIAVSGTVASFTAPDLPGATLRLRAYTEEGASDNSVEVKIFRLGGTK